MTDEKLKAPLAEINAGVFQRAGETVVLMLVVKELLDRLPPGEVAEIKALANQRLQDVDDSEAIGALIKAGMADAIEGIFT